MVLLPAVLGTYPCSLADGVPADVYGGTSIPGTSASSTWECEDWIQDGTSGAPSTSGVNLGSAAASCTLAWARANCAHTCCAYGYATPPPPSFEPPLPPDLPLPPGAPVQLCPCSDECHYPADGICDDGGPGFQYDACRLGTDCTDCGARCSDPSVPPLPPAPPASPAGSTATTLTVTPAALRPALGESLTVTAAGRSSIDATDWVGVYDYATAQSWSD
eukprot:6958812-Prymnesium_polylepis.1